jgi:plasmid stabilization system protein ParE
MDPNAALSDVFDAIADREPTQAAELAENLLAWMDRGGFMPAAGRLRKSSLIRFLRHTVRDSELDDGDE